MSEFEKKLMGMVETTFVGLSLALGKQAGLFDVLVSSDGPMTSSELAARAKQKERYVREWLGSMVAAGVVEVDGETGGFLVSQDKKKALASAFSLLKFVPDFMARFPKILDCCRLDGPAGISGGTARHAMAGFEVEAVEGTVQDFLADVPDLQSKLESGIEVAEFGSNSGLILQALAQRFPKSRFRGSDIDEEAVRDANRRVQDLGLKNVSFHLVDLCRLPEDWRQAFHWVFLRDVIHDLPHPQVGVEGLHQCLKEGGLCSVIDINASGNPLENVGRPLAGVMYTASLFYCMPSALNQDATSPALGAMWGTEVGRQLFTSAGFRLLYHGPMKFSEVFYHYVLQK